MKYSTKFVSHWTISFGDRNWKYRHDNLLAIFYIVLLISNCPSKQLLQAILTKNRNSHWRCSVRKGVLRNFAKFAGKHLCQSLFWIKLQASGLNFPVNFAKPLRTPFLQNPSDRMHQQKYVKTNLENKFFFFFHENRQWYADVVLCLPDL